MKKTLISGMMESKHCYLFFRDKSCQTSLINHEIEKQETIK